MFQLLILQIFILALINILFVLIGVAYYTLAERKTMSTIQRWHGNVVRIWGLLQLFVAGLKALLKEIIIPRKSNKIIFIGAPLLALILANAGWIVMPLNICSFLTDINFGLLYFSSMVVYDPEYFKIYWVGLLDGAGSIEVNHRQEQKLQFRITIKLKNSEQNKKMFVLMYAFLLIGKISIVQKDQSIIWVVQTRSDIEKAVLILQKYPPLTSKRICEFIFLEQCLKRNNVAWYVKNRKSSMKFSGQQAFLIHYYLNNIDFIISLDYFEAWLSGFIEAKGTFCVRTTKNNYFTIGHFNDDYIIIAISKYFGAGTTILKQAEYFFNMEIDKQQTVVIMDIYVLKIYKKKFC